jgi:hypothetical protein
MAEADIPDERSGKDWYHNDDATRGRESPMHNNPVTDSMRGSFVGNTQPGQEVSGGPAGEGSVQPTGTSGKRRMSA